MIKAIAIDLDDTLIDTTGLLLPRASQKACEFLCSQISGAHLEDCLRLRADFAKNFSHRELFKMIADHYGRLDSETLGEKAAEIFYKVEHIPHPLPLLPGALEVLELLHQKYLLFLVTSGDPQAQRRKIQALPLAKPFVAEYIVNKIQGESKTAAFEAILKSTKISANELLSVGNRQKEEIRLAKKLGATTCYFKYGEHVGEEPEMKEDHADFVIETWREFISTCHL